MRRVMVAALASLVLAACAAEDRAQREIEPPLLQTDATVLESPDHGPMLCLGGIQLSLPPECGTLPLEVWDWDTVEDEESMSGVTWGEFHVVGTYDGETFVLAEPPTSPSPAPDGSVAAEDEIATPCAPPAGGWRAEDPERATEEGTEELDGILTDEPDYAGMWVDATEPIRGGHQDFEVVLTVAFADDPDRYEERIREHWGGALCLWRHELSLAELERIADELTSSVASELGLRTLVVDARESTNVVDLEVVWAGDDQRAELARRYGSAVVVTTALRPV